MLSRRHPAPEPPEQPVPGPANHVEDHFFKGVCICPCPGCIRRVKVPGSATDGVLCICPDCPSRLCGAKTTPAVGATA